MSQMKRLLLLIVLLLLPLAATAAGQFSVNSSGQIIDPNGAVFVARGFSVTLSDVQAGTVNPSTIQSIYPRTNYVRIWATTDEYAASDVSAWVTLLTSQGIVVSLSDYQGNGPCRTGSDLASADAWYRAGAAFYASNPYVWWEGQNECFDPSGSPVSWQNQISSHYASVRAVAPNAVFSLGSPGGNSTPSVNYYFTQAPFSMASMTNVNIDLHPYAGAYAGVAGNQSAYDAALLGFVHNFQTLRSNTEPVMPVILGEFGNATDGANVDATGSLAVQAGGDETRLDGTGAVGFGYWLWDCFCNNGVADIMVSGGAPTNPYGRQVQTIMAAAPGTGPTPPGGGGGGGGGGPPPSTVPAYSHIVLVMMENHSFNEIIGPANGAPYINNTLVTGGRLMTNYFAITHPSEPNYYAAYAGSTFGIADDNPHAEPDPTLATILSAAGNGKFFVGYAENTSDTSGTLYAAKHAPWTSFPEKLTVQKDFSTFPTVDFNALPPVSFVVPNLQDDMHDGTVAQGDTWLNNNLNAYAQWAKANNSLLIVWWDEDDSAGNNQVPLILYGANVAAGTSDSTSFTHYNTLATICASMGISASCPNNASGAATFGGFVAGGGPPPPPPSSGTFKVSGGKVIGPNGSTVNLLGVDYYTDNGFAGGSSAFQLPVGITNTTACTPFINFYPKDAFVRLMVGTLTNGQLPTAAQLQPYINCLTAHNIVVAFDYHNYGFSLNGSADSEGQTLSSVAAWEKSVAAANATNPYVWCMTQNEPAGADSDFNNMITTLYNACRAGGNTAPVLITEFGGSFVGGHLSESTVQNMTNVIFDYHVYSWEYCGSGCGSDPGVGAVNSSLASAAADSAGFTSSDGVIPIFTGEDGNGPGGNCSGNPDPSWPSLVTSVANAQFNVNSRFMGAGYFYHAWSANTCALTQGNFDADSPVSLTASGVTAANAIAAGNGPVPGGGGGGGGGEAITVNSIGNGIVNVPFPVSGSITAAP